MTVHFVVGVWWWVVTLVLTVLCIVIRVTTIRLTCVDVVINDKGYMLFY
ncbi:MAG: hypothetical protein KDD45_16055 [Bdellovibrionales bacterium]|nr:hypothetical protein [Bdellovibrionales bacterium]